MTTSIAESGGNRLAKVGLRLVLGAVLIWLAVVVFLVTIDVPAIAPWTVAPSAFVAATALIWWRRPALRSSRPLQIARRISIVAVALLVVWALGITVVFSAGPIGPSN